MRAISLTQTKRFLHPVLSGAHMLAFLPALCLAAYWVGGEILLVGFALFTPLLFAAIGGFERSASSETVPSEPRLSPDEVAQDFLQIAQHNGQTTACFELAVAGLEEVRLSLGNEAAVEAKGVVAKRLKSALRSGDHVFETADNRFEIFLAPGFRLRLDGLLDIGKRLALAVEEPVSVSGTTQFLFASIGIASSLNFPRNTTADTWRTSARHALNEALSAGPGATRVWSDKLSQAHRVRTALREDLSDAFTDGAIQAHFQPQVSLRTGEVVGMEALVRWEHPRLGVIRPPEFLRALTDSGEIAHLGKTMLAQALSALQRWDDAQLNVPTISVNFSSVELRNPSLPDDVKWELDRLGMLAHRLRIDLPVELTTSLDDVTRNTLTRLEDMGCLFDLDDFGNGPMSMIVAQALPIHRVKIHQSLIRNASQSSDTLKLLKGALGLADQLGWETLAEGIETVEEHGLLRNLGCKFAQGFLISEPLALNQTDDWLRNVEPYAQKGPPSGIRRVK